MVRQNLLTLVFLLNFSLFVFEMLLPRIIAPFLGSSHWVWALVIAGVLLGMSLGYNVADKLKMLQQIGKPHFLSVYAAFIAMLWALSPWTLTALLKWGLDVFLPQNNCWGFLALGVAAIWIVAFSMLMTLPSPAAYQNLLKQGYSIGHLFIISTGASLLGIFLQSFLFITLLGSIKSFMLISLLWLIGSFLCWLQNKQMLGTLSFMISAIALNYSKAYSSVPVGHAHYPNPYELTQKSHLFDPTIRKLIYLTESPYNLIRVYQNSAQNTSELMLNEPFVVHSSFYEKKPFFPRFNDYLFVAAGIPHLKYSDSGSLLMLGAAAGSILSFAHHYFPNLDMVGVEIDGHLLQLGKQFFHLQDQIDNQKIKLVVKDARAYLQQTNQKFDFILVDTFSGGTIPAHLASAQFFALIKNHLTNDGIVGFNVPVITLKDQFLINLWQSCRGQFSHIYLSDSHTSRLLLLTNNLIDFEKLKMKQKALHPSNLTDSAYGDAYLDFFAKHLFDLNRYYKDSGVKEGLAYTDDFAPVEWDAFKGYLQLI